MIRHYHAPGPMRLNAKAFSPMWTEPVPVGLTVTHAACSKCHHSINVEHDRKYYLRACDGATICGRCIGGITPA